MIFSLSFHDVHLLRDISNKKYAYVPSPTRSKLPGCSRKVERAMSDRRQQGRMRFMT